MNINKEDLLTIEGAKYICLETLNYKNKNYTFVNKLNQKEEPTEDFYIFEILGDSIIIVTDENIKEILIPKFQELLKKDITDLINQ